MELGGRVVLLLIAVAVGVGIILAQRLRQGRLRAARSQAAIPADWASADATATLVQLSSAMCSACRHSARVWTQTVSDRPDVAFREVDAEAHLDVVRGLGVLTTPTTLVYDRSGTLRGRVSGAPSQRQAADLLEHTIGAPA